MASFLNKTAVDRRAFIAALAGIAAAWPQAVAGQQERPRIAVLSGGAEGDPEIQARMVAFRQAFQQLGWSEGRNVLVEYRWSDGDTNRARAHAAELIGSKPTVIFAGSSGVLLALAELTRTIPIVYVGSIDPVSRGLAASLAHPGGNVTGFSYFELSLVGKLIEALTEVAPGLKRVGMLRQDDSPIGDGYFEALSKVSKDVGLQPVSIPVKSTSDFDPMLAAFAKTPQSGVLVTPDFFVTTHRDAVIESTIRHRLPTIFPFRYFVSAGGLMSYGVSQPDLYRRAAEYVDRILKGEKPGDLPVQAPTKFELAINVRTAKAIGLAVAPLLLTRADEVIE